MVQVFAHRGASGPHPEMTRGAFTAAVELARRRGVRIGLECDVHFTADGAIGCLHDLSVARTARHRGAGSIVGSGEDAGPAGSSGVAADLGELTVAELRGLDFGAWRDDLTAERDLTDDERAFMTLPELLDLVAEARADGVDIGVAVEAKHPVPRDADLEPAIAELLTERGWTGAEDGIRMITFDKAAVARMAGLLPDLPLTYLIGRAQAWDAVERGELDLGETRTGNAVAIGPGAHLLAADPGLVARIQRTGRECHVWTVNATEDIRTALDLGVDAVTSDFPERVLDLLG